MIAQELQPIRQSRTPLTMEQIRRAAPSAFATEPYSGVSSRYAFIPTSDVITGMVDAGFLPFAASQSRTRIAGKRDFTKHMIRFRPADTKLSFGSGHYALNEVFPEVVLVNGHDGSTRYKFMGGMFRLICTNGLIVADSMIGSINIMHTGNVVELAQQASRDLIARMPQVLDTVADWQAIELTKNEQGVFAEAAREVRFADKDGKVDPAITPEKLLAPRRYADNSNDLWTVFNRVQENVTKGGIETVTPTGRRNSTRAVRGIEQDVKLNRALWTLAEKMAELKRG